MERIYFATNRKPNRKNNPTDFGKDFSGDGLSNLRFGVADVEDDRFTLQLHKESLVPDGSKFGTDSAKSKFGSLRVFTELREEMRRENKDTVVFIHGYNVTFGEALQAAARMSRNFAEVNDRRGVNVALFSWPSDGSMLPWIAYSNDRRDAAASGPAFARGILKLVDFLHSAGPNDTCEQDLHLVAHSMGNYVLRHALQEIVHHTSARVPRLFNQIFLMAPDEDDDAFEHDHKLRILPKLGKRVHVYFNRGDMAMSISDWTKSNPDRLGDDGPRAPFQIPAKVTQIDCTQVVDGPVEHSYYIETPVVVSDMVQVLNGVEPEDVSNRAFQVDRNRYVISKEEN